MREIFKVGDTVYHWNWGTGKVIEINKLRVYPVKVGFFGNFIETLFTYDGCGHGEFPTLSFTPYDLINGGFSQERPKPDIKPGQLIYVRHRECLMWNMRFFSHWGGGVIGGQPEVACFSDQAKDGPTTNWQLYSITNPLEL